MFFPPTIGKGDAIIYDEPGRCSPCVDGVPDEIDYHSHSFRMVQNYNHHRLIVRHGGGQEEIDLGFDRPGAKEILSKMSSDERFLMFYLMFDIKHEAERRAQRETAEKYREAFVSGELKKRKLRGKGAYKVWIEHKREEN